MRLIEKAGVSVFVIAGGMVYLAEYLHLPSLIPIAIGIFGLFGVWLGLDTFIQGKIRLWNRLYSRREDYTGTPARLLGTLIFLFGAGVLLYAFLEWTQPGMAGNYLAGLVGSSRGWGILLIAFGVFTLLFGLIRLFAGSAHRPEERRRGVDLGYRARGIFNVVFGIILLLAGVWLALR